MRRKTHWEEKYRNNNTENFNGSTWKQFNNTNKSSNYLNSAALKSIKMSSVNYSSYFSPDEDDSEDSSDEHSSVLSTQAVIASSFKLLKEALDAMLEDANESAYSLKEICSQLSVFRTTDKLKYQQAYISLSLPKLMQPFVMMDVIITPWIYEQVRSVSSI